MLLVNERYLWRIELQSGGGQEIAKTRTLNSSGAGLARMGEYHMILRGSRSSVGGCGFNLPPTPADTHESCYHSRGEVLRTI